MTVRKHERPASVFSRDAAREKARRVLDKEGLDLTSKELEEILTARTEVMIDGKAVSILKHFMCSVKGNGLQIVATEDKTFEAQLMTAAIDVIDSRQVTFYEFVEEEDNGG